MSREAKLVSAFNTETPELQSPEEVWGTRGKRANNAQLFKVAFSGAEIYALVHFLEEEALHSEDYLKVRKCVLMAEKLRERAKEQGF